MEPNKIDYYFGDDVNESNIVNRQKICGEYFTETMLHPMMEADESVVQLHKKHIEEVMKLLNVKNFKELDDFVVVYSTSHKISVKRKSEVSLKSDRLLYKLFPPHFTKGQMERAKKKGLKDIAPDFDTLKLRSEKKKKGEIDAFRVSVRVPAIALDTETLTPYSIGNWNKDKTTYDAAYYLPNVAPTYNGIHNEDIVIYLCYDAIRKITLNLHEFWNVSRTLIGKPLKKPEIKTTIDKRDQEIIWKVAMLIMTLSLYTYGKEIKTIVLPSSTGGVNKYVRDYLVNIYPKAKVVTIRKPAQKELLDYYKKHKSTYDEVFNDTVKESYKRTGKQEIELLGDVFYDSKGNLYDIWDKTDDYEGGSRIAVKMSKIYGYHHRLLIAKIMSDYVLTNKQLIKDIDGQTLVIDDTVTTGATLSSFVIPVVKASGASHIYPFALFGEGNNRTDKSLGIDYSKTRDDLGKLHQEKEKK